MAILFMDGFDAMTPDEAGAALHPDLHAARQLVCEVTTPPRGRGSVVADLPTMRWIGCPPVTFILTENPAGPQYPANVDVIPRYEPEAS